MNKNTSISFWVAIGLMVIGGLFLLDTLNIIPAIGSCIFPIFLILIGVAILVRPRMSSPLEAHEWSVPLGDSARARMAVEFGAGRLIIRPGAEDGYFVDARIEGGYRDEVAHEGDLLDVHLRIDEVWNLIGVDSRTWDLALDAEMPLSLRVKTGASDNDIDLSDFAVSYLEFETGASRSRIVLPKRGETEVKVEAGAASVNLIVPEGVAARIRSEMAIGATDVSARFPEAAGGTVWDRHYESADYETAPNRADIHIEGGVGSVTIT